VKSQKTKGEAIVQKWLASYALVEDVTFQAISKKVLVAAHFKFAHGRYFLCADGL
jgi:hypothetical protein